MKKFSELLKANSRRSDICGRIGGEEFLFILTHTTKENANVVIERIRAALEATKFDFAGGSLTVTASFGAGVGHSAALIRFRPPQENSGPLREWLTTTVLPSVPSRRGLGCAHISEAPL